MDFSACGDAPRWIELSAPSRGETTIELQTATYKVRVGCLKTPITLTLAVERPDEAGSAGLQAQWSHGLQTPVHYGVYAPGCPAVNLPHPVDAADLPLIAATLARLLAISYKEGVEAGHRPDESWIVPLRT